MKRTFKLLALAAVSMMIAVACNNAPEENTDTTPVDTTPVDTLVEDTTPVIDTVPAVEETTPAKAPKKTTKKQEVKKTSAAEQNVNNAATSGAFGAANAGTKKSGTSASEQNVNNAATSGSLGLKKN